MDEATAIFDKGKSDEWMTYEIWTEHGVKMIGWGYYYYDSEDGEVTNWRCVAENVEMPLMKFLEMRKQGISPVDDAPEQYNRPCDYIEDLTEEEARKGFTDCFNALPKLDYEYITANTPEGEYIGRYAGLRVNGRNRNIKSVFKKASVKQKFMGGRR